MKKDTSKNVKSVKKSGSVARATPVNAPKTGTNTWSLSIYIYWFIILFFIGATFYILGRSHGINHPIANNVEITDAALSEETLKQSADYYQSGKEKLIAGNVGEAIADLNAAIDETTDNVDAYILRGEAHMQAGNYKDAMNDFDHALSIDAENAIAYYDRALLNTRLESYNAALNDINNALAARASRPTEILSLRDLYAKRGQLNLWLKNWEGAIADYTNSLARPEGVVNPAVYAERAEAYTALGDYASAINDYATAVRIISEQIQGLQTLAEREDQSSKAMSYFEKSAALNLQLGNKDSALGDLESAYTIAVALNDAESVERLQGLITDLQQPAPEEAQQ